MCTFKKLVDHFKLLRMLNMRHLWCLDVGNSGQMSIPTSVDQVLDGYFIQTPVKIDAMQGELAADRTVATAQITAIVTVGMST